MSGHHGHHRSSHHSRSRMHHSSSSHYSSMHNRSRNSSNNAINDGSGKGSSNHKNIRHGSHSRDSAPSDWQEHKSSSGKIYYYNPKSGVSQWEVPSELRQQQQQNNHHHQQQQQQQPHHHQQQQNQQNRFASPESELSESSSIRQQENSPSSSASSHPSAHSDSITEDKPLLTPSLAFYYKPELISNSSSSHSDDLQQQCQELDREILQLNEKLLNERVEIKIRKSSLEYSNTQVEAQEMKCAALRKTIERFGIPNYQ